MQNALWLLGRVPELHLVDCLTAAVQSLGDRHVFQERFEQLLKHCGIKPRRTNPSSPHENGDAEQRHYRLKTALDQALMLRGSRDFSSVDEYRRFLTVLFEQLNRHRISALREELSHMGALPASRFDGDRRVRVRVSSYSTVSVDRNTYSVNSRLIGHAIDAILRHDRIELMLGQQKVDELPRLRGRYKQLINYRHIIEWLRRKPGAFENYRYREELFPRTSFRIAYDLLHAHRPATAVREYLEILYLAAFASEDSADAALQQILRSDAVPSTDSVRSLIEAPCTEERQLPGTIEPVDLSVYDHLLNRHQLPEDTNE